MEEQQNQRNTNEDTLDIDLNDRDKNDNVFMLHINKKGCHFFTGTTTQEKKGRGRLRKIIHEKKKKAQGN